MASINQIQIKNMKTTKGHDGEPVRRGTVYYNGKKLGSWSQSKWCGSDEYSFDTEALAEELKRFAHSDFVEPVFRDMINLDGLLETVGRFTDMEKKYKECRKLGMNAMVVIEDGMAYSVGACEAVNKEELFNEMCDFIEESKKKCREDHNIRVHTFFSKKDFDFIL